MPQKPTRHATCFGILLVSAAFAHAQASPQIHVEIGTRVERTPHADQTHRIIRLFGPGTPLAPPTSLRTPEALITRIADRARDRHAREDNTRYPALLGVPSQRNYDKPEVIRGKELFSTASCAACHTPQHTTSAHYPMAELRNQTIRPYTDLLLHDMGPGLADNLGEDGAGGSEWRTPPLWGIGLTAGVSGGEAYLHDGRARTLEEAILWHGGEAEASKEAFRTMPAADRAALIEFLRSL